MIRFSARGALIFTFGCGGGRLLEKRRLLGWELVLIGEGARMRLGALISFFDKNT